VVVNERNGLLTVAQVADRLQQSEITVRRKIRAGEIPSVRLARSGRAAVRVPAAELEAWLRSVRRGPDSRGAA
jgi:excisionase family DNA binding protein